MSGCERRRQISRVLLRKLSGALLTTLTGHVVSHTKLRHSCRLSVALRPSSSSSSGDEDTTIAVLGRLSMTEASTARNVLSIRKTRADTANDREPSVTESD